MKTDSFVVSPFRIRKEIDRCIRNDDDSLTSDYRTRSYYLNRGDFLWIDRMGVDDRADTLLSYLNRVEDMGFSLRKFHVQQISRDLWRVRHLHFNRINTINVVLGRLEYYLTKAYLRYTVGQRFGFMNPYYLFNRLDTLTPDLADSVPVSYCQLFDLPMEHADKKFYGMALQKVRKDSVAGFLREVQPVSPLYYRLARLLKAHPGERRKALILCNMERLRWRLDDYPQRHRKYVMVNIPSFTLHAVDGDSDLTMRVGCGTFQTKTPLLMSRIYRMDLNPQWIIPRSIVRKSILKHAGDVAYFKKHQYFVRNLHTGKKVDLRRVNRQILTDDHYAVIQEGGNGNSLGRIIFRFDNDFSIYLHDTSSKGFFSREDRGVSHGCIRVQKPFDLALFLLQKKDRETLHRIRYSMTADLSSRQRDVYEDESESAEEALNNDTLDRKSLVSSVSVNPEIPLFILYFTLYPGHSGQLMQYDDVYGYDRVIYQFLKNYR